MSKTCTNERPRRHPREVLLPHAPHTQEEGLPHLRLGARVLGAGRFISSTAWGCSPSVAAPIFVRVWRRGTLWVAPPKGGQEPASKPARDDPGRVLPVGDRKVGMSMSNQRNDPDYLQGQLQVLKLFVELAIDKIDHGERLGLKGVLGHHRHRAAAVRADKPLLFEGVEAAVTELTGRLDNLISPTMSRPRGKY